MANNCNLIKSVYRIDSMALSQAVAPFLDILLVMFISLGSMPNCWRGPEYSEKFCGKGIEIKRAIHSSWILSLSA